jgi:hypothetical protein
MTWMCKWVLSSPWCSSSGGGGARPHRVVVVVVRAVGAAAAAAIGGVGLVLLPARFDHFTAQHLHRQTEGGQAQAEAQSL